MKYILDSNGYVESASCNPISCDDKVSQEYKGTIPDGYSSLDEWILYANIRAYKIVNNNLVYDAARDAELQAKWALTGDYRVYSTDEQIIGTWINGKPIYRKVIDFGPLPNATVKEVPHGISNIESIVTIRGIAGFMPIPRIHKESVLNVGIEAGPVNVLILTNYNFSSTSAYVIMEYTKTTD